MPYILLLLFTAKAGVLLHVPACPEQHGVQTYAHPDLCDHFFKCTNGTVSLEKCENGLLYDGKGNVHEHCNYNWAVDCGTRKADSTYTELTVGGRSPLAQITFCPVFITFKYTVSVNTQIFCHSTITIACAGRCRVFKFSSGFLSSLSSERKAIRVSRVLVRCLRIDTAEQ